MLPGEAMNRAISMVTGLKYEKIYTRLTDTKLILHEQKLGIEDR